RIRREGDAPGAALVLRALRARSRSDPRRLPRGRGAQCRLGNDKYRPARHHPSYWQLAPGAAWHGFPDLAPGFAMTDPNKLTILTPGFDQATGDYTDHGIPAPVVAQYLRENRIVAEKNDLNSLLFLLTPGVEASKAGTLLSALVAFKKLHDENAKLDDVIGEVVPRRKRHARRRHRRVRAPPPLALRRGATSRSLRRDARLLPQERDEPPAV